MDKWTSTQTDGQCYQIANIMARLLVTWTNAHKCGQLDDVICQVGCKMNRGVVTWTKKYQHNRWVLVIAWTDGY